MASSIQNSDSITSLSEGEISDVSEEKHQKSLNVALPTVADDDFINDNEELYEPGNETSKVFQNAKKPLLCWFDELFLANNPRDVVNDKDTEESVQGMLPEVRLSKLRMNAAKLARHGDNEEAVNEKIRAIALVCIIYGNIHLQVARAYAELAEGYLKLRKLPLQAIKHAENARDILLDIESARLGENGGVDNRTETASVLELIYFVLGKGNRMLKKFKKADNLLQKAYVVSKKKTQECGISLRDTYKQIEILSLLGEVSRLRKQNGQAMEWFEKAIELIEEKLGDKSAEIISLYQQLAKTELQLGEGANFEKVFESYDKAKFAAVAVFGKTSLEYAATCSLQGKAYIAFGDRANHFSAETALEEAIVVYETVLGKNHKKTLDTKEILCKLLLQSGDYVKAENHIKNIISGKRERYGDINEQTADSYKMLGGLYLSQNKFKLAMEKLLKSLEIYQVVLGPQNPKVKSLLKVMETMKKSPATNELNIAEQKLKDRPRFNNAVTGSKQFGYTKPLVY